MTQDWARLGSALRTDREAAGRTQPEVGVEVGVNRNRIAAIEAGDVKRMTATIRSYARALGWADGSIEAVLAGGEPTRVVAGQPAGGIPTAGVAGDLAQRLAAVLVSRLPQRALAELEEGHVVDFDVVDLRPDGGAAVINLVIERGTELPPNEQVHRDLREWMHVQRGMRRVVQERQAQQEID